ncbi:hypothetical protein ACFLWJ_01175 [Chloroflexota bacterium]
MNISCDFACIGRRGTINSNRIKRIALPIFIAALAAIAVVALNFGNYSPSPPDSRGIGGSWKPYTLDAHSKMGDYFRLNGNEGVYTTNSEEGSLIYISEADYYTWISVESSEAPFEDSPLVISP